MRILVTGASGFVGGAVAARFGQEPHVRVRAAYRRPPAVQRPGVEHVSVADLTASTEWTSAVDGVDVVVHAAARVHVMHDTAADSLAEFRRVNLAGTMNLARQAARAGARRFVFISSIKVNGERTEHDRPFTSADAVAPRDPYGQSKWEAEQGLRAVAADTGMEVVVIRPVLVYGPGVKANFSAMLRWIERGIPLPFAAVDNRRSLVAVDNLADLVVTCATHPAAANETFLVSDGEDLSTPALLRRAAVALGTRARLVPVPTSVLEIGARVAGRRDLAQRLFGSLQVDIGATRERLGWTPPVSVDDALARTAEWYLATRTGAHGRAPLGRD